MRCGGFSFSIFLECCFMFFTLFMFFRFLINFFASNVCFSIDFSTFNQRHSELTFIACRQFILG